VAVEAALVLPIVVLILFGIIEFSLVFRDSLSITSATRQGARVASAAADAGPGSCETGPTAPPCAPTGTPALAQAAADAIQRAGSAMPKDSIDYILVYKANDKGFPGANGNTTMPSSCSGYSSCVKFVWRDSLDAFRYNSGSWDSRSINACVNESDTLGVYMSASHKMVSGFFGGTKTLNDRAVMKFEPLPEDSCKPGRPNPHP
jgi:hypothetical protein